VSNALFLDPSAIRVGCVEAGLGAFAEATLLQVAARIRVDPALCAAAMSGHYAVYDTDLDFADALSEANAALGADADILHALYVLDSLRLVRARQGARAVPESISRAVNERHGVAWLRRALDARGVPRLPHWPAIGFRLVGSGELYRLGRLEFALRRWAYPFRAYVHEHTGETVVLAERCAGEGVHEGDTGAASRSSGLEGDMSGSLALEGDVIGTPISPRGHAVRGSVRLPASEWRLVLTEGDWVLDIHVSAEGALALDAIRDAFERALPFFARYHPAQPFLAYACDSWLFSTQLESFLCEPSNILTWQREGYLLPGDGGHTAFLTFTFGSPDIDLATAARDTRLRRAVLEHLAQGKRLHDGFFLLLRRDLARFGNGPYRDSSERAIARLDPVLR
jgi:hypothetical protein